MNLKEIFEDLKKNVKLPGLFKKSKKEDEDFDKMDGGEEASPAKESFNNGSTGPIAGINRKWIKGGAIFFILVFVLAFYYGSSNKKADPNQNKQPGYTQKNDIADPKNAASKSNGKSTPDSYEELLNANKERTNNQQRTAQNQSGQPTQQAQRLSQSSYESSASQPQASRLSPLPAITSAGYSQPYSIPSQQPSVQAVPQAAPQQETASSKKDVVDKVKDQFKAAIAFAMGGGDSGNTNSSAGGTQTATTAGSAPAASAGTAPTGGQQMITGNTNGTYTELSSNTLPAGTLIPAMLLTGINTDIAGQAMVQIQSDVYDYAGNNLLIPAGSKLMGTYDQQAANGRVNITFTTLQTPEGGSWAIGNSIVAVDGAGYMGIQGNVHDHTAKKIGNSLLKSALTAIGTLGVDRVTLDSSAFGSLADTGSIKTTVTVDPGYQFNVYVTQNIAF